MSFSVDPVELTRELIRVPSITPVDAGAMDLVQRELERLGFACRRMTFEGIENLYARRGTAGPNLCFAGHTDVVPPGDTAAWRVDPFEAKIEDGWLIGRGAADMKGAIAAFVAAVERVGEVPGSLSFLITGDEEGRATHGTKLVVEALIAEGERIDHCVVGEPSSAAELGDMMKVGRRGSLNAWITVEGRQGHVAYPQRAANPISTLTRLMARLQARVLDEGYDGFPPSNLEFTTVDVANPATNVIPARASARLNIRFNPAWNGERLMAWLSEEVAATNAAEPDRATTIEFLHSGDAFLTEPGPFVDVVAEAVKATTGRDPDRSTTGGTSDARFIRKLCPVVEFGLVGTTIHQVDERTPVAEIEALTETYAEIVRRYFARFA